MSEILYPVGTKPPWEHSNRGVHLHSGSHHTDWLQPREKRDEWLARLKRTHMTWVVMLTSGMSAVEVIDGKPAVTWLLEEGIVPIIRDYDLLNYPFRNMDCVSRLAEIYKPFGIKPIMIYGNEPFDDREWRNGNVPDDAADRYLHDFKSATNLILDRGGIPGFADPLMDWDYFFQNMVDIQDLWRDGLICFTAHCYGKGRPMDYPEDDVSHNGTLLTEEEHREALDDYYDSPAFHDVKLERINSERFRLADPTKTFLDDSTCVGAWRNVRYWAREHLGCEIPMALTEGAWVPHDKAGTGPNNDDRWPQTTPKKVAERNLAFYEADDHGMFSVCAWLFANRLMGGGLGAPEDDCYCTGSWLETYPVFDETPIMVTLEANPPGTPVDPPPDPPPDPGSCTELVQEITPHVKAIQDILGECKLGP